MTGQMNHERFSIAIEQTVNPALRKIFARHRFATVQIVGDVRLDKRNCHLQERYVNKLAASGFAARQQRRHDAVRRKNASGMIDKRNAGHFWVIEIGDKAHNATERLDDGVESGLVAIRTALAIAGNRTMNESGITF